MISDAAKPCIQVFQTFCSFVSGAQLIVIQHVVLPHLLRRKVWHIYICPCEDAFFPAILGDCSQCRSGGKENLRQQEAYESQHEQRKFQCPCGLIRERRIMVRNKRSDTDHLGIEFFNEKHVIGKRSEERCVGKEGRTGRGGEQ